MIDDFLSHMNYFKIKVFLKFEEILIVYKNYSWFYRRWDHMLYKIQGLYLHSIFFEWTGIENVCIVSGDYYRPKYEAIRFHTGIWDK